MTPIAVLEMTPGEYLLAVDAMQTRRDGERAFTAHLTAAVMTALTGKKVTANDLLGSQYMIRQHARDTELAQRERDRLIAANERAKQG